MKKIFISFIAVILLMSILLFPGCGGGGGGDNFKNQIKVYETSRGFEYMSNELNQSGIVFADSFNTEIGNEYILYVSNLAGSITSSIQAIAYDEQGNIKDSPIILEKNPVESNCFSLDVIDTINGKISADIIANAPGGYCELNVACEPLSRIVKVWVYNSVGSMSQGEGYKIDNVDNGKHRFTIEEECSIYEIASTDGNLGTKTILKGNAYPIDSNKNEYWGTRLRTVKSISDVPSIGWLPNQELKEGIIYIAENNFGGYIKIVRIGSMKIWEYSDNGEFN